MNLFQYNSSQYSNFVVLMNKNIVNKNLNYISQYNSSYNPTLGYTTETIKMIDTKNYKDYFTSNVMGYLKLTLDYSVYTSNKFDIVVGAYIDYDFGLRYQVKGSKYETIDTPIENISSVDLGIQVGTKIIPMN